MHLLSNAPKPVLEVRQPFAPSLRVPFVRQAPARWAARTAWVAELELPPGEWEFRVDLERGHYEAPAGSDYYCTRLRELWLQGGELFDYAPAPHLSPSRVVKIPEFSGLLRTRPLYLYLPRGYSEHESRRYPVLYMHDGQNVFESFAGDSFSGTWRADEVADRLIARGRMRECLIVGVSNGGAERIAEYLPPYADYRSPGKRRKRVKGRSPKPVPEPAVVGRADRTVAYYRDDVAPFVRRHYRALEGREHAATCGSSMGGLFSHYLALEHPDFARHHAVLSPSYWITKTPRGQLAALARLRGGALPDVRLWLDSGTEDAPGRGDDGMKDTLAARNLLLGRGFAEGPDFHYHLAHGAVHHESAWAARLHLVLEFLFPLVGSGQEAGAQEAGVQEAGVREAFEAPAPVLSEG